MTTNLPYAYRRTARNMTTAIVVITILALLFAAWLWLEASPWIMIGLALFNLPAIYDLIANPLAGLDLTDETLSWFSGRATAKVPVSEIDHIRLDTRLDFSVRATAVLDTGRKIRLPFEATPPHRDFETALEAHGIKTKRFHFQLMQ